MDLQTLFSAVLNMSITGSIVIVCVILARLALRGAPRVFSYALWAVVLFRLLCPVSVSAPVSVLTVVDAPAPERNVGVVEYVPGPVRSAPETVYVGPEQHMVEAPEEPIDWQRITARVWAAGAMGLAAYGMLSYVNLKRRLREAVPLEKGVKEADGIKSPFVLGLLRPVIYLPAELPRAEREYIVMHEKYHVRHLDPLVRAAFYGALCLHWFNPLVWIAFSLAGRDMEMRCDEAVLKKLGTQVRSDYAQSLLNLATGRRFAFVGPLAFGDGDTGKRVKHVLGWKKKAAWMLIPAAALCAVVLVLTACNPAAEAESPFGHSYRAESTYASAHVEHSYNTNYTLTSDMAMIIRGEKTEQAGFFREVPANVDELEHFSEDFRHNIRRCWHIEDTGWWLLELKNGQLQLHNLDQSVTHILARTDLLGVTIRQSGAESDVEPTWHRSGEWDWPIEELPTTLVNQAARIILTPEVDVDTIVVEARYFETVNEGEYGGFTITEHTLERNANGEFVLDVRRRGTVGDDEAVYQVTVGEEHYLFRLTFPMVPGAASGEESEETYAVEFSEGGAYISLQLPESWDYEITSLGDNPNQAGITFWPRKYSEGALRFEFYPDLFGVCGTGLETQTMQVGEWEVSAGTYDNESLWSFLSFGEHFAVWGEGHEAWWTVYGETAMEILASAQFGEYVDMEDVRHYFRNYRLYEDLGPGEVLLGEKDYQAVYYPQRQEVLLYEYRAGGTSVEILNAWSGRVYEDLCISVNCLEREGEYVYFGYLRSTQDGKDLTNGAFEFLLKDGWTIDMILREFRGFCFVCDEPMADFELRTESGELVMDLDRYLASGGQVNQAEGRIVLENLDLDSDVVHMCPIIPEP